MPLYYTKDELQIMFINSNEPFLSQGYIDILFKTISAYISMQSVKYITNLKYYNYQGHILYSTNLIVKHLYPISGLQYKSIISNSLVSYKQENYYIVQKINEIKSIDRHNAILSKSTKYTNKLIDAGMDTLLPIDILQIIAYHLVYKRPSRKRPSTNWQNFCKQRKLSALNYKDNSSIWQSLSFNIKTKYKNPYYKHF